MSECASEVVSRALAWFFMIMVVTFLIPEEGRK